MQVAVQFSQHHLLKRLFSPVAYSCPLFVDYRPVSAGYSGLSPAPLICASVVEPVLYCVHCCSFEVQSDVRECDSSALFILS